MADVGTVLSVIQLVIELATLIAKETDRDRKLHGDLKAIEDELHSIKVCLRIAEKRPNRDDCVKEWIRQVRILSFDIQDSIEEYQLSQKHSRIERIMSLQSSTRNLEKNIASIRENAKGIFARRNYYNVYDSGSDILGESSRTTEDNLSIESCPSIGEEGDLVGVSSSKTDLMTLLGIYEFDSGFSITCVVGQTGVGKTSLVGSIYHDHDVRDYFVTRAWINVPKFRDYEGILRSMIMQFHEADVNCISIANLTSMDKESLECRIDKYLENKRYMIVFDDVETKDKNIHLAEHVKNLLNRFKNNTGSKVLVTTCYEEVAHSWQLNKSHHAPYQLQPLPFEDAFKLFCKKALQSPGRHSPPQWFESVAKEIVEKCNGLPSKLGQVGEVLWHKDFNLVEWQKVSRNLGSYLSPHARKKLLQTYYVLSPDLKLCLLYFGMFPYDYGVERMRIIRLWIAEGFISNKERNLTLEEVAEDNIEQLIKDRLVEVKVKDHTGKPKILGISHEDLYDIIVSKVEESNFCKILSARNSIVEVPRRLSIHENHTPNYASEFLGNIARDKSKVRCLLSLTKNSSQHILTGNLCEALLRNLSLLKILDLQDAHIVLVPEAIGELLNLSYLSLKRTQVRTLPKSITKLQSLKTLNLKHTLIEELPKDINHLVNLRNLLAYKYHYNVSYSYHVSKIIGVKLAKGASLSGFTELQQLAFLDVSHDTHLTVVHELLKLKQLRRFGIIGIGLENEKQICDAIQSMVDLEALSVYSKDKTINLEHITTTPNLKRLYLEGRLIQLPSWIIKTCCLVKLRLRWSKLRVDPLKTLQQLPSLVELQLLDAFEGDSILIENNWFPKLKVLNLLDLPHLITLSFSQGALPILEEMSIGESKKLNLPSGIEHLTNLKKLLLFQIPSHFKHSMQQGKPFHTNIEHVHELHSYIKTSTHWHCEFTLHKGSFIIPAPHST